MSHPKQMGCLMKGCLSIAALVGLVLLIPALQLIGGGARGGGGVEVLPEVSAFLLEHPEFGEARRTQAVPNWLKGKRQRITSSTGRELLFYMLDGQVVTVYEDAPSSVPGQDWERKKIWNIYAPKETPPKRSVKTLTSPFLSPAVVAFLDEHDEFGTPRASRPPSKSMMGYKQSIEFESRRTFTFYEQEGQVTRVFEDLPGGHELVWARYRPSRGTDK